MVLASGWRDGNGLALTGVHQWRSDEQTANIAPASADVTMFQQAFWLWLDDDGSRASPASAGTISAAAKAKVIIAPRVIEPICPSPHLFGETDIAAPRLNRA